MDKYEYKLKLDELKTLVGEQKYEQAAELCDELNWKKVKNVNSLVQAGEAYEKVGRFEDAREVLLAAYDRAPIGRMIIYRLTELAIRMKNFDEAREYYDEFIDVAPHDNMRYVLRYEMMKGEGVPLSERIALLEEFKEEEYTERWAFELAYLYHKVGDSAKCVDTCDELVLWFGDGPYVEKALELKMLYQPLNKIQEQKYRDYRIKKNGGSNYVHTGEKLNSGEIIAETIRIPDVSLNTEKYNTVNLQAEIARSMEQIANAKEKETVSDSMDIIKKMVEEIPYLQIEDEKEEETSGEEAKEPEEEVHIETVEEIDQDLNTDFERYLAEENDGQMRLLMPDGHIPVPQITGQLSIDEVLAEWEKTRRAAAAAMQDNEERRLESQKQRALKEAQEILEKLTQVLPQLEAGMTPKELLEEKYTKEIETLSEADEKEATRLVEDVNGILKKEIDRISQDLQKPEPEVISAPPEKKDTEPGQELVAPEEEIPIEPPLQIRETPRVPEEEPEEKEATPAESLAEEEEKDIVPDSPEKWVPKDIKAVAQTENTEKTVKPFAPPKVEKPAEVKKVEAVKLAEEEAAPLPVIQDTIPLPEIVLPESLFSTRELPTKHLAEEEKAPEKTPEKPKAVKTEQAAPPKKEEPAPKKEIPKPAVQKEEPKTLTAEERGMFSYFLSVDGMEEQISNTVSHVAAQYRGNGRFSGHVLIQGVSGNGKTTLATDIVKAVRKRTGRKFGNVATIEAAALNRKDIGKLFEKMKGGVLMIEGAGYMSASTASKLAEAMKADSSGIMVIMEGTKEGLNTVLSSSQALASRFLERIVIPAFTSDELVNFAKAYANEEEYEIDEMAVLALYDRISRIERLDEATTLSEVKEIVDKAIDRAERVSMRNLFGGRRSDENGYVLLQEKDFT